MQECIQGTTIYISHIKSQRKMALGEIAQRQRVDRIIDN